MKIRVKGHLTAHDNYKKGFRAALQEDQEHDNWEKITESKHETARVYNASLPFFAWVFSLSCRCVVLSVVWCIMSTKAWRRLIIISTLLCINQSVV